MYEPTRLHGSASTPTPHLPAGTSLWAWRIDDLDSGFAAGRRAALDLVTRTLLHAGSGRGHVQPLLVTDDVDFDDGIADGPTYLIGGPAWDAFYRTGSIYWTVEDHLDALGPEFDDEEWPDD